MTQEEDEPLHQADLNQYEADAERREVSQEVGCPSGRQSVPLEAPQRPQDEARSEEKRLSQQDQQRHLAGTEVSQVAPSVILEEERTVVRCWAHVERIVREELCPVGGVEEAHEPVVRVGLAGRIEHREAQIVYHAAQASDFLAM